MVLSITMTEVCRKVPKIDVMQSEMGELAKYLADYVEDAEGFWVGSVRDVAGCQCRDKTLEATRVRLYRALLALRPDALDNPLVDFVVPLNPTSK